MRKLVAIVLLLLVSDPSFAAVHFIRAGGGGSLPCNTSWATACSNLPSTLVSGDTYYVAGGSYGSGDFTVSSSTIATVQAATIAVNGGDTGWSNSYAAQAVWTDWTFENCKVTFDGMTGGGPGSWGTGFGFTVQMPVSGGQSHAIGIGSSTCANAIIRHTDIQGRGRLYGGGDTDLIYMLNAGYSNWLLEYDYLHDTDRTMILTWPNSGSGMTIQYSYFARNGIQEHREAWSLGPDSNVIVRYNLFEDIFGTGVICAVNNQGTLANWQVYGNAFYWTGVYADGIMDTGVITISHSICPTGQCMVTQNFLFYNNTISGLPNASPSVTGLDIEDPSGSPGAVCENNIWYNNKGQGTGCTGGNSNPNITTADYNWFFGNNVNGTSGAHDVVGSANPFQTSANPNFPFGNWELVSQISGLAVGSPYNTDALGNGPSGGITSRGAYQFTTGASATPASLPSMFAETLTALGFLGLVLSFCAIKKPRRIHR